MSGKPTLIVFRLGPTLSGPEILTELFGDPQLFTVELKQAEIDKLDTIYEHAELCIELRDSNQIEIYGYCDEYGDFANTYAPAESKSAFYKKIHDFIEIAYQYIFERFIE